jgi:hypothetical protein
MLSSTNPLKPIQTCVESAWSPLLKLDHDELLSNIAFNFNLRPYTLSVVVGMLGAGVALSLNKKGEDEGVEAE